MYHQAHINLGFAGGDLYITVILVSFVINDTPLQHGKRAIEILASQNDKITGLHPVSFGGAQNELLQMLTSVCIMMVDRITIGLRGLFGLRKILSP